MTKQPKANRGPSAGPENRRALVAAAREIFGARGADAPLSAVAKRAGVGQGSLYRHFPDRVALAAAVFDENIGELEQLLAGDESGVFELLDGVAEQAAASASLFEMVVAHRHDSSLAHLDARIRDLAERMLRNDRSRGTLSASVDVDDVLLAVFMMASVLARTSESERGSVQERARAMFRAAFVAS
ncbi:TetR/AcrR family transcriptional regulator [Paramicrobacterium agarici]|uniref:TetR family transcriptional regulator n=1 Tax=Paramicrobacterium agarici TaxID=630514 RepID=A0A2A9DUL0_9MICO|nr:TetR/AcrR family transcriptional regulator [Microbacterium agarici]PFG30051.1 TetR family transcriptional regulator [Microbacterium agarici]TQO23055.1 TetR family transcriptional regulator [Microbacterium agarici]